MESTQGIGRMGGEHGGEPEEAHGTTVPTPHHHVNYIMIFLLLVVLTVVTVAIATVRFQNEVVNVLLALLVASVKATFVALYFMHLKFEGKLIYLILFVPLGLCVLLVVALIPDILNHVGSVDALPPYPGADQQPH